MDKLNDVFLAAKTYYNEQKSINAICDFEYIAVLAKVEIEGLEFYLTRLQRMNLIRYCMDEDKYLFLTSLGGNTPSLIK